MESPAGVVRASLLGPCVRALSSRSRSCFSPEVVRAWRVRRASLVLAVLGSCAPTLLGNRRLCLLSWGHVCVACHAGVARARSPKVMRSHIASHGSLRATTTMLLLYNSSSVIRAQQQQGRGASHSSPSSCCRFVHTVHTVHTVHVV